jgi:1-acyl-sn-glycerol-3-phosphate acyltransferase
MSNTEIKPRDHSLFLKAFRAYIQFVNSGMYFKKEHVIGLENVPANGTPLVVVSNHQNCLNDPLCVCLKLTDRRMNFLARANVFKNPIFNKALRALGLLPAYRMGYESFSEVRNNNTTLNDACNALTDGETVMLYPEAGHQDKRWLGVFKLGYLRIAFAAAEKMNFEEDVVILPSCNHYSNYFHARTDMMMKFGKPISLKPYYERYQQAPRETMMEINKLVRSKIQEMMLHVDDLEHYDQIDFIRENGYGRKYAKENGFQFNYLPSRLLSDQKLVNALQSASAEHPEEMEAIYKDTAYFAAELKRLNIRDWLFQHNPGVEAVLLRGLGLLLLLPFFIVSIVPTALLFLVPKVFLKILIKDQMFISTFNVAVSALVTVPICLIIPIVLLWIYAGFWWALGYFIAFPFMFIIAWNYMKIFLKFIGSFNFVAPKNRAKVKELKALRKSIFERLDNILK